MRKLEVKLQTLRREFECIRMQKTKSVGDYCEKVNIVVNKMETLGEVLKKGVIVKKCIDNTNPKWNLMAIIFILQ